MMMVSCKDMGATDCDFVAKGENAYEVKMQMMDHAKMDHKEMTDKMDEDGKKEMMKKMMMNMKCA